MTTNARTRPRRSWRLAALAIVALFHDAPAARPSPAAEPHRYLYVAEPGIRNYLEYGGHGLLVFDIDQGHRFVKRIKTAGIDPKTQNPENVKGVCASARTGRIYVSTIRTLTCLDLRTESILWEKEYEGGCDRMAIAPDGATIYVPSFEKDHWTVVDAADGHVLAKIVTKSGAHNTVYGLDGKHVYLAGLRSPMLTVATTAGHDAERTVGPFSAAIRPFTVNGRQTLCFVNVNGLLGFEVGDLSTGRKLHRVEVQGYAPGPVKRHGCPSHGIGMTPDEKELWVVDAFNQRLHIFDTTVIPPRQVESLKVRDEPGWVTFSIDGKYAYPSTGEVIECATRTLVAQLKDENGAPIMSEKMVEIDFDVDRPVRTGDQFGVGRVTPER
jgi:DNA-binding beta-propeller fold protein YncE